MTATQAPAPANYEQVVQTIREWPPEAQADLAQTIIRILARVPNKETQTSASATRPPREEPRNRRALSEWMHNRLYTTLPAPSDEEVAQWIDEHRMEKYG